VIGTVLYENLNKESTISYIFGRRVNEFEDEYDEKDRLPFAVGRQSWNLEYPLCAYRSHSGDEM